MKSLRFFAIYLAWVLCLAGSLASLYFSEIRHIEPCRLCWLQRIALFPMAIQLGIFAYRSDSGAAIYCMPLCLAGFTAALLQSLDLVFDFHALCGPGFSCRENMIYVFGALPFSWISAGGFAAVAALLWLGRRETAT